jgi:hypothetical protein
MVHNRINEFTGGVVDTGLFSTLVPLGETFESLTITVDFHQLASSALAEQQALLALLFSVMRDIKRGSTPFGWGTSKGFGHLDRGSDITMQILDGQTPVQPDTGGGNQHPLFSGMPTQTESEGSDGLIDVFSADLAPWRSILGRALSNWYDANTTLGNTSTQTEAAA